MSFLTGQIPPDQTWRMEQFSRAYVKAVAAAAGCAYWTSAVDNDALDVQLRRATTTGVRRSPQLDIQLKATTANCVADDHIAFPLDIPTYDKLRPTNFAVPRILVVVVMHPDVENWTSHSEDALSLSRCGYWLSLVGQPEVANEYTKTVHLPRTQKFDAVGLDALFLRLSNGDDV